jgi:hypothetical protein
MMIDVHDDEMASSETTVNDAMKCSVQKRSDEGA